MFCTQCARPKQLFPSQVKAEQYLVHNRDMIFSENGYSPIRSYYCENCRGWHTTSLTVHEHDMKKEEKERIQKQKQKSAERRKNTGKLLDKVENYVLYTLENYKKGKTVKAIRMWDEAWKLFLRTMKSEYYMNRKLFLFNQLSVCQELLS